nr:tRNA (N(6)-L-threonylcarbamoyladenosine(37)-C(2))-methylthiotransferase MtaB [Maliibacterium massiliense]
MDRLQRVYTVAFYTLGCKVNQYDTQAMREQFLAQGFVEVAFHEAADVYVVNTCTVTHVSDRKSRQMIARAHRKHPDALVIVAGCYAQRAGQELLALPGVGMVLGPQHRAAVARQALEVLQGGGKIDAVGDIDRAGSFEKLHISGMHARTRAVLKIQEGCDQFCAYCIIPYVRGPIRSRPLEDALQEARTLAAAGVPEIVLTGIHLTSYGRDLGQERYPGQYLADLLEAVDRIEGIVRIRLGSLEPALLNDAFLARASRLAHLCPQFHVALQSGSDGVLARMGRAYDTAAYALGVEALRHAFSDAALTTDMMVGFPGETEAEFEETCAFAARIRLAHMHVFPYSPREGTRAASMPGQVPAPVKEARAHKLMALGKTLARAYAQQFVGSVQPVLFEEPHQSGGTWGRTPHDLLVLVAGDHARGSLKRCKITELDEEGLCGLSIE